MAPYTESASLPSTNEYHSEDNAESTRSGHTALTRLQRLKAHLPDAVDDLVCIGFGPASLAIAIAIREKFQDGERPRPRVTFLEQQPKFAWHSGMLLPGSKMQISFIKDLATLRNPKSDFTFLNYLHQHNRLVQYSNLGTFLPSRIEFEDYMRWCAEHFEDEVTYGQEVLGIHPGLSNSNGKVDHFAVKSRNRATGAVEVRHARNVVVAIGGKPRLPAPFPSQHSNVIHSSSYVRRVHSALPDKEKPYRIAVVGNGQSAAEIFNDLHSRFPNSKTYLIIKDTALRPSDDSPFVNEVFNPERVDSFYEQPEQSRADNLKADKSTNYGVVRLELLEHIYGVLYQQRIKSLDERDWQHHILASRTVSNVKTSGEYGPLILTLKNSSTGAHIESLEVNAIFVGTGYTRDAHENMMQPLQKLARPGTAKGQKWRAQRNYKVDLDDLKVEDNAGVWLQGCNQDTHGLADTLLSILAIRGGEMVDSIFGTFPELLSLRAHL